MSQVESLVSIIQSLGGTPSPKLISLLTESYSFSEDEILKAKLVIAFSAKLPVDYIHILVQTHSFKKVDSVKDKDKYRKLGVILTAHFSNLKILKLIQRLDDHSYHFYLETLEEFYHNCRFFLKMEILERRLHRHLKNFKQIATVLHEVLNNCLEPDSELELQKTLFETINNIFLNSGHQIFIPVRYEELKQVSHFFNNCLGSPIIKKQIDDKDFAIVVLKKNNKFIAVMDVRKTFDLNNIKAQLNVNLPAAENLAIREAWTSQIIPRLIKKSIIF